MTRSRLTAAVAGPVVVGSGLASLALLVGSSWLLLLAAAAVCLIAAAALVRPRVGQVTVSMSGPARVAVGEPVRHRLRVDNRGRRPSPPMRLTHALRGLPDHTVFVGGLPPGGTAEVDLDRVAESRGVAEGCLITVESSAPLGLLATRRETAYVQPLVVHPAVVPPDLQVLARRGDDEAVDPRPGPGLDVAGVRDWQHGDDPRRVHWRSTARRGRLVVAERGLGEATSLGLDVVGPAEAPDWEAVVARAAATTRLALVDAREVAVRAWTGEGPGPVTSHRAVPAVLDWWAALGVVTLPHPQRLVAAGPADPRGRVLTVVASRHVAPRWWDELHDLAAASGLGVVSLVVAG